MKIRLQAAPPIEKGGKWSMKIGLQAAPPIEKGVNE